MGVPGMKRQRCLKCRHYFTWTVIDGKWCSPKCAGTQRVSTDPNDWPRKHFVPAGPGGPKREKMYYFSQEEAASAATGSSKTPYHCDYCGHWHIGSLAPNQEEAQ